MLDLVLFAPHQTLMGLRLMTSLAKYTGNVNSVSYQLIGKSELVSFGKDMNPSTKSFQSAYSKIHGKKFFFYKPTQIAENTLQSLKAKLDANRMKTSTTGGVIGTFRLCGYEKGVQVG
ncbi:hypothetical protein [Helicobacter pylori]|uniref:hypothetical protein n=1 Tax=Helicobacter pylori TaxID=210 RepID=UPI001F0CB6A0|nr:hypothetical protein [Helicobacter pylori]